MKKLFGLALLFPTLAFADPFIDLVPTELKFRKGLDDDVSMSYSQHVWVYVRNDGNVTFRNSNLVTVALGGVNYRGWAYGPDNEGGSLGGPIGPGKTGKLFVRLPLNTLRHCSMVGVHIDVNRTHQASAYNHDSFANDRRTLRGFDFDNRLPCLLRPLPPLDPILRP